MIEWVPHDIGFTPISPLERTVLKRYSVAVVIPALCVSRKAWVVTCKTSCGVQSSAGGSIALHQTLESYVVIAVPQPSR